MKFVVPVLTLAILAPALPTFAQTTTSAPTTTSRPVLPVREVTIFKDGHAFVLHEGSLPVGADGTVEVPNQATPVLGTFWPYAINAKLAGVVSSRIPTVTERTAQTVRDLLKANTGARVTIVESDKRRYDATILGAPELSADEIERMTTAGNSPETPREELILLQTSQGVRVAPLHAIQNVLFKQTPRTRLPAAGFDNLFRYQFDWAGQPQKTATVGMVYLQQGLQWIPSYRIALDGNGAAKVKLQATLVNNLTDLQNINAHLVIGVPSFAFQGQADPIALHQYFAQGVAGMAPVRATITPSVLHRIGVPSYINQIPGYDLQNRMSNGSVSEPTAVTHSGGNEDFYVFAVRNLSLKAGERMVVPVAEYDLKYQDIYTLQTPPAPPPSLYSKLSYQQQSEVSASQGQNYVMHKIRLSNSGTQPLTTAPALIESNGQLLAQTTTKYTATGGRADLDLAPAADVTVKRNETEVKRTPDVQTWREYKLEQIDVTGKLTVTSFRNEPITLELTRQFVGTVTEASHDGKIRKLGAGDDDNPTAGRNMPTWWGYGEEYYRQANSLSSVTWTVTVPPKQSVELSYAYNYFWR